MDGEDTGSTASRFSTMIESDYDYTHPRRGQVCQAVVLSVTENDVVVDLGAKRDGFVPRRDLELLDDAYRIDLQIGDRVPVCVLDATGPHGEVVVSLSWGLAQQDWLRAQECLEDGEICQAAVEEVNRGGVVVPFGCLQGFVPNSQLRSVPRGLRGDRLWKAKSDLVGRVLSLAIIEVNQRLRRLVMSERVAARRSRQQLLDVLTEGEVRIGVVRRLVDFGAFVDLGGLDGLIHISELAWRHVKHPSDILAEGDEVEVYVLKVDRERERVGLSRKRLLPDPWPRVAGRLSVGQVIEGTVTKVAKFGVFVDVGEGIEGLIHNSEIPDGSVSHRALTPDHRISVRVLRIDRWRRRIALSLRDVGQTDWSPIGSGPSPGGWT